VGGIKTDGFSIRAPARVEVTTIRSPELVRDFETSNLFTVITIDTISEKTLLPVTVRIGVSNKTVSVIAKLWMSVRSEEMLSYCNCGA
jgi:hypothetical protein